MKKTAMISLALCLALLLGACSMSDVMGSIQGKLFEKTRFQDDSNYTYVQHADSVESEYYSSNGAVTHGYDSLYTDSQRKCYELIGDAVYRISEDRDSEGGYPIGKVCVEDKTFTDKDMDISIKAFTMDHPEVFWITNRYKYGTAGNQSIIQLYSYVSGSECKSRIETLTEKINSLIAGIPSGLKEYHLEKYIHNTVLDGCTYARDVETADDGWEEFTVYGTLINGSAVCEGYAHAMCLLLNKVGIDCYYANGYGENAPHMWNTVKIYDEWYHLDATWDDNDNAYFNYFNLNDPMVLSDHIIEPVISELKDEEKLPTVYNLFLPKCSSTDANYFVVESTYIDDFEDCRDVMVSDLINAANSGDEMFTIRFSPDFDFKSSIDVMFNEEPYYMFSYIEQANNSLDSGHQITDENLAIIMIENFNAVVVKLEY